MPTSIGTATNVSAGKPNTSGAIYRAVRTNDLVVPTTVGAALSSAYKCLGYISEDGFSNKMNTETADIKAWGGDTVLSMQTGRKDAFTFELLEVLNDDVLKAVYCDSNVTATAATTSAPKTITVNVNGLEHTDDVWVIDVLMRGNNPKRIVIPYGKITELDEIVYKDDEAVGYKVTLTAAPDTSGNTHYEYMTVGSALST